MCGIVGAIDFLTEFHGVKQLEQMLKKIKHRGPDSSGVWAKNGLAFGMQRLSIIDIEGGEQPIWTDLGTGIVFNGEIYNYKEIRGQLQNEGVVFKTQGDTEVIVQLYDKKGISAIHKLEGMFSICIYDSNKEKLYLVRDRVGIKPLYYFQKEKKFIFSSEIKSILAILKEFPSIDKQSLWHYLTLRYVPAPDTIWQDIKKLDPGSYLEYDLSNSEFKLHKYWQFEFNSKKNLSSRDYDKEFETIFLKAVEKRLLASDVPVGIMLSGGLDSSCVASAAIELGHQNFHTFSIGFEDGGDFSELKYAEKMAKHIGSEHHEIVIKKKQFLETIEKFVWHTDEPLADLASIPLYFVSELASNYVKVALSGEGADEIFAGYNFDSLAKKLHYLKIADMIPNCLLKFIPYNSIKQLCYSGYQNFLRDNYVHMTDVFSEEEKSKICNFKVKDSTYKYIRELYAQSNSKEPIEQLQQVYCKSWLVEDLLMKADKMSMATSLELRVPFLDHKLVEWATELPLKYKVGTFLKGFSTKKIVRKFAEKRIPSDIINRSKQGFPVPAYNWLADGKINSLVKSTLNILVDKGDMNREALSKLLDSSFMDVKKQHKVWNLIVYAKWLKKWLN